MVELHIKFKSRQQGTFGNSPVGRTAEWLTTTWVRFTCSLIVILVVAVTLASNLPPNVKLNTILVSPIVAVLCWHAFLFLILVSEYLGVFGKVLSRILVLYFYLFSRLIVQQPPMTVLGLTKS